MNLFLPLISINIIIIDFHSILCSINCVLIAFCVDFEHKFFEIEDLPL